MLLRPSRLSAHLALAFGVLIVVTALSTGIPAYWLIRSELDRQTWAHVEDARQSTLALIHASQNRLADLVTLAAERPTLRRLIHDGSRVELDDYLLAFRLRAGLDILLVCDAEGQLLSGDGSRLTCAEVSSEGFALVGSYPAMLVSRAIPGENEAGTLGMVTGGIWLDDEFFAQLASETGLAQSLILPNGTYIASSLPDITAQPVDATFAHSVEVANQVSTGIVMIGESRYYAGFLPLFDAEGDLIAISEVALPVNSLAVAENRALGALAVSTGLIALFGLLLGWLYARRLTAPLKQLEGVAAKISQGDLSTPVPRPAAPLEVATLATALEESRTEMLRMLGELSQARDWLNNLVQSVVEGVVTFDTQGRITFFNQGAERITGWASNEALGRSINEVFRLSDGDGEQFISRIPPRDGRSQVGILSRSGRPVLLAVTGARLASPANQGIQIALVLRDVTEEEALRHLRSYFLANISHEFRTPLSALSASVELLLNEAEDLSTSEMRELLQPTYLSLLGLQTLIDNLLESSRIEAGHFTIHRRSIALNQVIADALRMVHPLLERRQQTVSLEEPVRMSPVHGDPTRMLQVLVNLLSNASKYSPPGTCIDLTVEQMGENMRVSVADRGPGIPPADRASLFHRFVRLDAQTGEQYGVGLGLYVVRAIVEGHGGRVGVEDRPGGGSVFWFEIPVAGEEDDL